MEQAVDKILENIQARYFVNYENMLNIIVRLHLDAKLASGANHFIKFRFDYEIDLDELDIDRSEKDKIEKLAMKYIEMAKIAFREELERLLREKRIKGNTVEFYMEDGKILKKYLGKDKVYELSEIKPESK